MHYFTYRLTRGFEMPSPSSPITEFQIVNRIIECLKGAPNVMNSRDWTLRRSAERFASFTKFGNVSVHSTVKNRSAKVTVYVGSDAVCQKKLNPQQAEIMDNLPKTLAALQEYIKRRPLFGSIELWETMTNFHRIVISLFPSRDLRW